MRWQRWSEQINAVKLARVRTLVILTNWATEQCSQTASRNLARHALQDASDSDRPLEIIHRHTDRHTDTHRCTQTDWQKHSAHVIQMTRLTTPTHLLNCQFHFQQKIMGIFFSFFCQFWAKKNCYFWHISFLARNEKHNFPILYYKSRKSGEN